MGFLFSDVGSGDVAAMPTCSGKNLEKSNKLVWLLLCYVGALATFGGPLLSTVNAKDGAGAAKLNAETAESSTAEISFGSFQERLAQNVESGNQGTRNIAGRPTPVPGPPEVNVTQEREAAVGKSGQLLGPAAEDEAENEAKTEGKCTPTDTNTIFWRGSGDTEGANTLRSTDIAQEERGNLPVAKQPPNPFYDLLLTCGQQTLAILDQTKACVQEGLVQAKRDPLTEPCIGCFMQSVDCGAHDCRANCFPEVCAESCIKCNAEVCRPGLKKCTGLSELPPLCVEKEVTTPINQEEEEAPVALLEGWDKIYTDMGISREETE